MFIKKILSSIIQRNPIRQLIQSASTRVFIHKLNQVDDFGIAFICDRKQCSNCSASEGFCKRTTKTEHAVNYGNTAHLNINRDFEINVSGQTVRLTEKER